MRTSWLLRRPSIHPAGRLLVEKHQIFNSRSTQLVLGAGAIHSAANLKSISAKHLALCSQSLGLVRALIPYLKAALATRLPQKHHLLLAQMDTVAQVIAGRREIASSS